MTDVPVAGASSDGVAQVHLLTVVAIEALTSVEYGNVGSVAMAQIRNSSSTFSIGPSDRSIAGRRFSQRATLAGPTERVQRSLPSAEHMDLVSTPQPIQATACRSLSHDAHEVNHLVCYRESWTTTLCGMSAEDMPINLASDLLCVVCVDEAVRLFRRLPEPGICPIDATSCPDESEIDDRIRRATSSSCARSGAGDRMHVRRRAA